MCGIIGCISNKVSEKDFISARDKMTNRGPDDAGHYFDEKRNVRLGHRRLSIIDLSPTGHQPMISNSGNYVIVFNGEVYNYLELKRELKGEYDFKTRTDTEVILAAYIRWGEDCVNKFNGMFAFAIYDIKSGKLFCVRDRFGVKPFYYYRDDNIFVFASEIKSILALGVGAAQNDKIIYDYLAFGYYDHSDETFFENIRSLPAGCNMRVGANRRITLKRYWDLNEPKIDYEKYTYGELQEKFKTLLEDSIRLRFRSDVPVGVNVSSGVDSTSLLFFSEKVTQSPLRLFSMCLPDEIFNECRFIKDVLNDNQKRRWYTSCLNPEEVFILAEQMNMIQDEPYGGIPTIAYTKLNEQAKNEGTVVLLEGQGVDEILAGYSYYRVEYLKDLFREKRYGNILNYARHLTRAGMPLIKSLYSVWSASRIETSVRSQDMTKQLALEALNKEFVDKFSKICQPLIVTKFKSDLLNAQYRDIMHTKLPRVLRFNDHATMHYSRELRVPYLDYRLVEFAFFLPNQYKIQPGRHKRLLRDAMKSINPEETNRKEKVAFGAVQTPWFRKYFEKEIMERLESDSFKFLPYFNHDIAMKKARAFFQGEGDNSFFIWQWLNLAMWFEKFIK
ncbi:asparagine synthase (glutamine-hydrolyzing) [Patescibacteria group bacterium]|nr:asparagine synthase (glutamine-hydrolyzing) [Patescibacteria group bacterium]